MKKLRFALPNILTFINLSLGVIAILLAVSNDSENIVDSVNSLVYSSLIIMIAAITDRLDGKVARILGATSELGKQLDSLSDLISFGVAPIIVAWKLSLSNFEVFGYLLALIFPIAGAYRLARYNIAEFKNVFTGIPITIAGAFLSINNLYNAISFLNNRYYTSANYIITFILIPVLSFLMVSKFKIKKI